MSEQLIATPGVFGENGNFLLERELGAGGMGGVYMGRDKMLDRPVAVKVMLKEYGDDAEFVDKFKKEAQACARLIHPNIAQIYSYGICDGMPYIAMELASGGSLYTIMQANPGKTDVVRVIKICQQTAQALQCASDQGCVHGDVKPENILLDANGNAKLVDFGLAAMQKDTDEIWGTPYYISPEKVKKEPIDFRADMYSLGGTLYHALTGVAPFEGEDSIAVVRKRFEGAPRKPSEIRPELTPAIDTLVMKMLELDRENRYPSFEALLEAFKSVLTSGLTANATQSAATGVRKTTVTAGTRRMVVRGRRMTTVTKKPTTVTSPVTEETEAPADVSTDNDEEDEEGGGNLGVKIAIVIGGVLLAIGAIVGGLFWFSASSKKAEAEAMQRDIVNAVAKARVAITNTVAMSEKFADEFDDFSKQAVDAAQKATDELVLIVPEDERALLKPGPTKELLDAIAATNEAPVVVAAPAPAPAAAPAGTNVAPAAATVPAATNAAPVAKSAPTAKPAATPVAKPATTNAAPAAAKTSSAIAAMKEVWERAYTCQACAVRIRHAMRQVVKKAKEADAIQEETRESVNALAEISRTVAEMYNDAKGSKDVETVKRGITFIKSKGESTIKTTKNTLRLSKLESERKAKAEAAANAEKEAAEREAAEMKAKIEQEQTLAADKFASFVTNGDFRRLDWKHALDALKELKEEGVNTPEGKIAVDLEIQKVKCMESVHKLLTKKAKGYQFTKKNCKLKGYKIASITEKDIQFKGKDTKRMTWQKFLTAANYSEFFELVNRFVYSGRKYSGLNLRQLAENMTGSALIMRLVLADDPAAAGHAQVLMTEAVKQFPEYAPIAQKIFPDMTFENVGTSEE